MIFSSIPFLYYFLPAVLMTYYLVPKQGRNAVLLVASMFFYAWGEQLLVLLFAGSITANWVLSLLIEKRQGTRQAKLWLLAALVIDLGLLVYFKYADFFLDSFNTVFSTTIPLLGIALPIGISFYTFQLISYAVDVYRGDVAAQHNIVDFAAYVSLFPQLIAGPIVRYADVAVQLQHRRHTVDGAADGIRRFLLGLGKKVLLANTLGALCRSYYASGDLSVLYYWLYAVAFSLQIYFDFSGYSDMAIGLGKFFGFSFPENFDYPYISRSITEFWRRWHITLGSWFRDYVYIPLGGNQRGLKVQLRNILIVWMLTGLWHGAAWNFVLWGLWFALLLTIEKLGLKHWLEKHTILSHGYVMLSVIFGFVLFDAANIGAAGKVFGGMLGLEGQVPLVSTESVYMLRSYGFVLLLAILFATPLPKSLIRRISSRQRGATVLTVVRSVALSILLLLVTAYLVDGSFNPFLYFRF